MSAAMSAADAREAVELRAYVRAYETALNEVKASGRFTITPDMRKDMDAIIAQNPNPLIRVHLLHLRLKETDLGQRVYAKAILGNDHGLAERIRNSEKDAQAQLDAKIQIRTAEVAKAASDAAAAAAAEADVQLTNSLMKKGVSYGIYTTPPAEAVAPLASPLTIVLPKPKPKPRGGKKSYKKSHKKGGKKSHKKGGKKSHKKGGKKSHKKSHRRRH
jgi:hypothetical protein